MCALLYIIVCFSAFACATKFESQLHTSFDDGVFDPRAETVMQCIDLCAANLNCAACDFHVADGENPSKYALLILSTHY